MRLIDADKLIKRWSDEQGGAYFLPSEIVRSIEEQPTADVQEVTLETAIDYLHKVGWMQEHDRVLTESAQLDIDLSGYSDRLWQAAYERGKAEARKTGKWKMQMLHRGVALFYCSECGFGKHTDDERKYGFCPNCGAEMRGDRG